MIDSMPSADVAERFERRGIDADATVVARTRREFALWLQRSFALDQVRCSDLVLATNEALANAAEFAYRLVEPSGTIDLVAVYDPAGQKLTVDVSDRGTWRPRQAHPASRARGRGIPLMEALSDRTAIETSGQGTVVRLEWNGVRRNR